MNRLLFACLAITMHGCAALPDSGNEISPNIDSLRDRAFMPKASTPLILDEEQVRKSYDAYVRASDSEYWRRVIERRRADMEIEGVFSPQSGDSNYSSARQVYEKLLLQPMSGSEREHLLYSYARTLSLQGETEMQQRIMEQLLREFPDTRYRTELEFRIAEHLFVVRNYQAAAKRYEAVLASEEISTYQEKARYKLAWSLYRSYRYAEAVARFLEMFRYRMTPQLVARGTTIDTLALSDADRQLMQDVVRGVALAASAGDEVSLQQRFKEPVDQAYAYLVYEALVERFVEQSRYHDAAETAREFVQRWPLHNVAPRLQLRLLDVIEMGGFVTRLEQERADFVNRYHPQGENWRLLTGEQREMLEKPLKQTIVGLAQRSHGRAQLMHAADDYKHAAQWYRTFLDGFPEDADAPKISYLMGDVLYENRQYAQAAAAYEKSAYQYSRHPKSGDAGFAALQCYRKHEEGMAAGELRDNWHWLGVSSALTFINRFPEDGRTIQLLSSTAQELYALHRYQRAADLARLILMRQPQPDPAVRRSAWIVLGYSEFELGHYDVSEQAYREVLTATEPRDPQRPQRIEWLAASIYKQAEQARDHGNPVSAAAHFMRVGELVPDTKIRVTADYDAAASMMAGGHWESAIELLLRFRNSYRNSPLQTSISEKLAVAYMRSGRFAAAAREFEEIAAKRAEAKDRREALQLSAELYGKAQDATSQQRLLRRYIREFQTPLEPAIEARNELANLAKKRGASGERDQWYREMIVSHAQQRNEQTVRTRYLVSAAQLELARAEFEAFAAVRLTTPLAQSLQRKKGMMEAGLALYDKVLDYGSAETTTEATWHIAEMQRMFGRALLDSERPSNLNAEEMEQYELMLEEKAYPFEENAIKVHALNTARIPQGIYDTWVMKSMSALVAMKPSRYDKQERQEIIRELR